MKKRLHKIHRSLGRRQIIIVAISILLLLLLVTISIRLPRMILYIQTSLGTTAELLAQRPSEYHCKYYDSRITSYQVINSITIDLPASNDIELIRRETSTFLSTNILELLILQPHHSLPCGEKKISSILADPIRRSDAIYELRGCYEFWSMVAYSDALRFWDLIWKMDQEEVMQWKILADTKLDDPMNEMGVVLVDCEQIKSVIRLGMQSNPDNWHATIWYKDITFGMHIRSKHGYSLDIADIIRIICSVQSNSVNRDSSHLLTG